MLRIFEDKPHMSITAVEEKYPCCRYVMHINEPTDAEGELLAISDSMESEDELGQFAITVRKPLYCLIGGLYLDDLPLIGTLQPVE